MNYTVYADVLLGLNFFLDFFLLWAAGRFLRRRLSYPRLLLSAAVGAVYGVGILITALAPLYAWPVAILMSLVLLLIAYPWRGIGDFLRLVSVFYLIAFAMAGAALGASSILASRGIYFGAIQTVRAGTLLFSIAAAVMIARQGLKLLRKGWQKENFMVKMEIFAGGRSCIIPALIDTGNNLEEPISGLPVIVAAYASLRTLLPQAIRQAFEQGGSSDPAMMMQEISRRTDADGWVRRLRLVPFASIGKNHGLLLGFRPDRIIIYGDHKQETTGAIVCLSPRSLSKNEYAAVINPQIMLAGEHIKEESA